MKKPQHPNLTAPRFTVKAKLPDLPSPKIKQQVMSEHARGVAELLKAPSKDSTKARRFITKCPAGA